MPAAQFIDKIRADPVLGKHLAAPSVSYGAVQLYAHGIFEAETRPNLGRRMAELVPVEEAGAGGALLTLNDKKLQGPMRLRLRYSNSMES